MPQADLRAAIVKVADVEAPLHQDDLIARVASMWGVRQGARIRARIMESLESAVRLRQVPMRGEFVYRTDGKYPVRSRGNLKMTPERVAPEEYREAILLVLGTGHGFTNDELANEVRGVLGFGKAPGPIREAVNAQLSQLIEEKIVGEGSLGLMLRG